MSKLGILSCRQRFARSFLFGDRHHAFTAIVFPSPLPLPSARMEPDLSTRTLRLVHNQSCRRHGQSSSEELVDHDLARAAFGSLLPAPPDEEQGTPSLPASTPGSTSVPCLQSNVRCKDIQQSAGRPSFSCKRSAFTDILPDSASSGASWEVPYDELREDILTCKGCCLICLSFLTFP